MEKTIDSKRVFDGKVLQLDVLTVELESGRQATRAIVHFPQVVAILPILKDGTVICVRQCRKAIEPYILTEAVAGKIDPGEGPEDAARRELAEETGYEAKSLTKIGVVYPVPGYSDELQHFFIAEVDDVKLGSQSAEDVGRVEVIKLNPKQFNEMVKRGDRLDGKLLSAITLAMAHSANAV